MRTEDAQDRRNHSAVLRRPRERLQGRHAHAQDRRNRRAVLLSPRRLRQTEPVNPLASSANRCFVCGNGNPVGLNVRFRLDGDVCRAEFTPAEAHVGYDGVTHGGILFSLLDDVMANYVFLGGERCYTAKAEVRYRLALPVGTPVKLEGRQIRRKGRLAVLEGRALRADDDAVVAEAIGRFMVGAP